MKKMGTVAMLSIALVLCYLILIACQPAINSIVTTANASTNWTGYESTQNTINSFPLYVWFVPFLIYIIVIAIVMKTDESLL
jgi:hypothetical protein